MDGTVSLRTVLMAELRLPAAALRLHMRSTMLRPVLRRVAPVAMAVVGSHMIVPRKLYVGVAADFKTADEVEA